MPVLVVVESPNKVAKVKKCLGAGYEVVATIGHFRDLPDDELGVDVATFTPSYRLLSAKGDVASRLKRAASHASEVLLATDADREGEAIAWHVVQVLGLKGPRRIRFQELTTAAVKRAAASPAPLDVALIDAQQARRVLDRLVGYQVSPLLRAFGPNHSAGRVQSAALHLVVLREKERQAFVAVPFWRLTVVYREGFQATSAAKDAKGAWAPATFVSEAEARAALAQAKSARHQVEALEARERERRPPPPFTTSTLQQAASARLGFTPAKTMATAQSLFEQGVITYHRTDSVSLSDEAIEMARSALRQSLASALPAEPVRYRNADSAQEAHEAIRPTALSVPDDVSLSADQQALLELVSKRFLASQCKPARLAVTTVRTVAGELRFLATGTVVLEASFLALLDDADDARPAESEEDVGERTLPPLSPNQSLTILRAADEAKTTKPPPRFTQAGLIAAMERSGIGRPSTYAATITTLFERDYLGQEGKSVLPQPRGLLVDALVAAAFPTLVDAAYTADMERRLDDVAGGQRRWKDALRDWYGPFAKQLAGAELALSTFVAAHRSWVESVSDGPKSTGKPCPRCGKELLLRTGKKGAFLACSGYPACDYSADPSARPSDAPCPACGGAMEKLDGRFGAYARCLKPGCTGRLDVSTLTAERCPRCGKPLRDKGAFLACSGYPACRFMVEKKALAKARKAKRECPQCGQLLVERKGPRGPFLACLGYPTCRHSQALPGREEKSARG